MKNIRFFLSEKFSFLVVTFSMFLNRRVFVMVSYCPSVLKRGLLLKKKSLLPSGKSLSLEGANYFLLE